MTHTSPTFEIRKTGHSWALCSNSAAAEPTGGVAIANLSLADARANRDTLRAHGRTVKCPDLDALCVSSSNLGRPENRPVFSEGAR